jgi:hypothetical protein
MSTETIYPKPTTDDYCFLDETDEAMGVETKKYENGNEVKRVTLSSGKIAQVRELKAWEMEESSRLHQNDKEKITMAVAALSTTIDDVKVVYEELRQMKGKDWLKIKYAVALINF